MTRLSIERPLTILMAILAFVLMGGVGYSYLNVDRLPPVSFPFVIVAVSYPQAAAQDVEELVSKPIEDALAGVPGALTITSTSSEGRAFVRVQFVEGVDPDMVALDVERRIARIRDRLPADAGDPVVRKADPNEQPVINIALTGAPLDELYDIAQTQLQPALASVVGVSSVTIQGGLIREVQVRVDYAKLAAHNLSVQQVSVALANANVSTTAGTIEQGLQQLNARTVARFQTPAELEKIVIANTPTGGRVLLSDVASVREGFKELRQLQRINGEDAVGLSVVKASNANALKVTDGARATIERMKGLLPEGTNILIRNDASVYTRIALNAVQTDIMLAVLLIGLVTLIFLHNWRHVLIIVLSIPTSMISTFLIMYLMGFSLNLMTLMALALTVGILVDASIVVTENIHRHLQMGSEPREAALKGRNEIGTATLAIAAADCVVYLPIAFMAGGVGQLFRQYGLTVVIATIFSLLISYTLTPMLASRLLRREENDHRSANPMARFGAWWDAHFDGFAALLERMVPLAIRGRWIVVAASVALVASSFVLIQMRVVGTEYAPPEDDGNINLEVITPSGTSLAATDQAARQMENALYGIEEVDSVFTSVFVSGSGLTFGSGGRANMTVQLKPKHDRHRSVFDVIADIRRIGRDIPNATVRPRISSSLPGGGGTGLLSFDVSGPDLDVLTAVVADLRAAAESVRGLADLEDTSQTGTPEIHIVLDPQRMAQLNVTAQEVSDALRTTLGGRIASAFRPTGKTQRDITVIADEEDRKDLTSLMAIPVKGGATLNAPANPNPIVMLGQIASLKYTTGPVEIERVDRNRSVSVRGVAVGRSLGDVAADMRTALATVPVPAGYTVRPGRQVNQFNDALIALLQALALALILEYMLLVALYESWFHPFVLLLSVPLGLVGSIYGLWMTGNTINIFSLIGLIMAFGLVAKNGILLIDFANALRARGVERTQALAQATRARLRPILMTSATMVFGMLPLTFKFESGAESRAPMAVVVVGAVLTSTMLAVVVMPAVYTLLDDLQIFLSRKPALVPVLATAGVPIPVGSEGGAARYSPRTFVRQAMSFGRSRARAPESSPSVGSAGGPNQEGV